MCPEIKVDSAAEIARRLEIYIDTGLLSRRVDEELSEGGGFARPFVIAIDGGAAAGKSTLAEILAEQHSAGVIHMDDFFLPEHLRTPERLNEPGGNVDYGRFAAEILSELHLVKVADWTGSSVSDPNEGGTASVAFTYRRFDCRLGILTDDVVVPTEQLYIVEGAYSMHPRFGKYYDFSVYLDIDSAEQERRLRQRNPELWSRFEGEWLPYERNYAAAFKIREEADLVFRVG